MSSSGGGSFGESGERRRVAHRPTESTRNLIQSLAFKKKSVSQLVNKFPRKGTNQEDRSQFSQPLRGVRRVPPFQSNRKMSSSEEDEEEMADDSTSDEENYSDLSKIHDNTKSDDDGNASVVGSDTVLRETVASPKNNDDISFVERLQMLSDSGSEEDKPNAESSVNWLGKPRLNGCAVEPEQSDNKIRRKRAVILSSSSSGEDSDRSHRNAKTLKLMVKKAKRRRREASTSSEESYVSNNLESEDEDNESLHLYESSSDEEATEPSVRRTDHGFYTHVSSLQRQCLNFFNESSRASLLNAPRVTDKVADFVISNRPFVDYSELKNRLSECPRGSAVVEQYFGYLENTNILQNVIDDCRRHSEEMQFALEDVKSKDLQMKPKLLSSDCELHPYQQLGLSWLVMMHKLKLNAILADEMGLGKTIQVIAFLAHLKGESMKGPHLIVVPSSTIENWMGEFAKWSPKINIVTYYGSIDDRRQLRHMAADRNVDVLLTTYNMIGSKAEDRKFFKKFKLKYVIYDEGHLLKNCATDRYKNLMKVSGERKILMTGTPLQNNLAELISLMYFTMTKLFTKYCDDIGQLLQQFQQKIPSLEAKNGSLYEADKIEQAKTILQPYILRRLKADVLSCLPDKSERVIKCGMTPEQRDIYTDLVREFREIDQGSEKSNSSRLMQLRQIANHPLLYRKNYFDEKVVEIARALCSKESEYKKKNPDHVAEDLAFLSDFAITQLCSKFKSTKKFCLDKRIALESGKFKELDELLPKINKKGDKVLIFSQFTTMMDILEVYLTLRDYKYVRLDGSTPVMERQELINEYNSSPNLFVFLLSTKAGGLGINLTAANHIILHDIDFNPYNDKQAEGRCHRMGQKKHVYVVRLISTESVEEEMLSLAQRKLELEKEVVTGGCDVNDMPEACVVEKLLKKALTL